MTESMLLGYILAGFTFGLLVGVVAARSIQIYRKKRGWND